ncbi:hypothetical protein [Curtobacterium sp. MCBA15_004]|uniref:hypothetical protein n=1 Tax=Curtobacterium sp. MCBA15_004 TaxID=1898733 RepID=UPI0008DC85A9|nr:hypothetical protein [Curtobacterium sp. MCBA15_004]WIA98028.1 hypothetical protein QOL16_06475 [Curtobacterium sp. MCBA15_004]
MPGGFSVAIGSDTRLFEQGVKTGVIDPVEDAQEALQDLARQGERTGDGLERGMRDGERALDDLGDAGKDAGRDIESGLKDADRALDRVGDAGKEAGSDLERSLKDAQGQTGKTAAEYEEMAEKIRAETAKIKASTKEGFEGAGGATGEFKDEALSNFSEITSSFSGDMSSITDLAQGTFGGLASMGGPASLAFGGLAVAVGLIGSALTSAGEESDEFQEKIQDLAQTKLGELFGKYEDSGDSLSRGLRKWATDADSFGGSLDDLREHTREGGLEFGNYAEAIATQSVPKMKAMRNEVEAQIKTLDQQAAAQRGAGAGTSALAKKYGEQADAAREVKKQLDDNLAVNDEYEESLRSVAAAMGMTVDEYKRSLDAAQENEKAQEAAKEAQEQRVEEQKAKLQEWADTVVQVYQQTADSEAKAIDNSVLNASEYAAGLEQRTAAARQFEQNIQAIGEQLPADLFNFVRDQGPGFSEEIATYLSASPEQKARIQAGWQVAAKVTADTTDVDKAAADQGKKKVDGPTSEVRGDTKDLDKKVDAKGKEKPDGPTAQVRADTSKVDEALKKLNGQKVAGPTIVYQVDTTAVDRANRRITSNPLTQVVNQQIGTRVP